MLANISAIYLLQNIAECAVSKLHISHSFQLLCGGHLRRDWRTSSLPGISAAIIARALFFFSARQKKQKPSAQLIILLALERHT